MVDLASLISVVLIVQFRSLQVFIFGSFHIPEWSNIETFRRRSEFHPQQHPTWPARGEKPHKGEFQRRPSVQPFNAPFPRREPRRVENKNKNRTPGREKRKRRNEVKRARWSWQGAASGPADGLTHTRTHTLQTALIAAVSEDLRAGQRWLLPHKESLGDAPLPTKWRIYQ